jgi:hypothetical protein
MLWVFATAGVIGVLCGWLFRAPALVFLSFVSFGGGFVFGAIADWSLLRGFVTAILLTAILQLGYLFGAGLRYLWQRSRSRGSMDIGPDFRHPVRRASQ